jgi:hypothetical protein
MRPHVRNNMNWGRQFWGRLMADRKKAVTTGCLVIVMLFLWIRVLTKNTPEVAKATAATETSGAPSPSNPDLNVSFVALPKVAGRDDVITRDFFACDGWRRFTAGGRKFADIEEVNMLSQNGSEEAIKKVAEKLRLEAIVLSNNPRAFINNRVRSVGDRMLVEDGNEKCECEVVAIRENTVVIKCREAEITLKLVPVSMLRTDH